MPYSQESAEALAARALAWLAASDDLMPVFLGATGAGVEDIKARAGDPEFLSAVLDFLTMHDAWVVGFCDAHHIPYTDIMEARAALPGGGEVHWT
ncbi:MAG: DUF3572 domain-containing protein [Pseudomonadota bacterium]